MAMTRKKQRLVLIGSIGAVLVVAVGLVLAAFQDQIVFFNSPSDLATNPVAPTQRIRLGGLVEADSIIRGEGTTVTFAITDTSESVRVTYTGILPDLFREGEGVVAEGTMGPDGVFVADTVLAKHDETYMPREVVDSLKEQGVWQGDGEGGGRVVIDGQPASHPGSSSATTSGGY